MLTANVALALTAHRLLTLGYKLKP
jgi:hypothetical protein